MNPRRPLAGETLDHYVLSHGIRHFRADELTLLRRWQKHEEPPRKLWPNIIPTLLLAEEIRTELGVPLVIGNAYRPKAYNKAVGGARRSKHLSFSALDLDLRTRDRTRAKQEELYQVAVDIYTERAQELKLGLGMYRATGYGPRIHIDTYCRWRPAVFGAGRNALDELR